MKHKCLNQGSVELINHTFSGDLLVVNAARCSFGKHHSELDIEKDPKLINYLAKNKHLLPFRHPSATLRIVAPLFVLRQLMKHSVGMSWSEVSKRYIDSTPEFLYPLVEEWRERAPNVKQGSTDEALQPKAAILVDDKVDELYHRSASTYEELLDLGVCPEQARMVLPQAMLTTVVVTGTLLSWFHLWDMRTELHAQKETQEYGWAVGSVLNKLFPYSWEALTLHASTYNKENREVGFKWYDEMFR